MDPAKNGMDDGGNPRPTAPPSSTIDAIGSRMGSKVAHLPMELRNEFQAGGTSQVGSNIASSNVGGSYISAVGSSSPGSAISKDGGSYAGSTMSSNMGSNIASTFSKGSPGGSRISSNFQSDYKGSTYSGDYNLHTLHGLD